MLKAEMPPAPLPPTILIYLFISKQRKRCCSPYGCDAPNGAVFFFVRFRTATDRLGGQIWSYFPLLSCAGGPPIAEIFNMFSASSSHKSCKYRQGGTQSEGDLGSAARRLASLRRTCESVDATVYFKDQHFQLTLWMKRRSETTFSRVV